MSPPISHPLFILTTAPADHSPSTVFAFQLALATFSLFPSPSHRASRESKRLARESRYAHLDSPIESKIPAMSMDEIASAPPANSSGVGPLHPMTPRTLAFNRLGGTKDLPLRNHFHPSAKAKDKDNGPKSPSFSSRFALRSPTFPGSPLSPGFDRAERKADVEMGTAPSAASAGPSGNGGHEAAATAGSAGMYFPPPPKVAVKGGK